MYLCNVNVKYTPKSHCYETYDDDAGSVRDPGNPGTVAQPGPPWLPGPGLGLIGREGGEELRPTDREQNRHRRG